MQKNARNTRKKKQPLLVRLEYERHIWRTATLCTHVYIYTMVSLTTLGGNIMIA